MGMAGLEVRRLLNRAVASSLGDEAFLVEARRLAREHGCELLQAILTNASLDVVQAQLMHGLLCRLPLLPPAQSELSDAESASPAVELLFNTLRKLLSLAGELSTIRTQSLLLFLGLLTMPQLPQLSPAPSGTDSSAAISPSASSTAALVSRNELLAKVLLPPLQRARASFVSSSAELSLILQAFPFLLCFASLELYLSLHRNSHLSTALLSLLIITLSFINSHLSSLHSTSLTSHHHTLVH